MRYVVKTVAWILAAALFLGCGDPASSIDPEDWPWETPEQPVEPEEPETPEDPVDPEQPEDPAEPEVPVEPEDPVEPEEPAGAKARYVWIDAAANFKDYADDQRVIADDLARIKNAGFTDVIVDVRPTNTGVLFNSATEGPLTRVDAWVSGRYVWLERTADFDYLQTFIDEGHNVGLRVHAAMNTFVGGCLCHYGLGQGGILFDDPSKKSWATVVNTEDGLVNVMDLEDEPGTRFLNPANDQVVEYLLNLISDLASYQELDGIVLDRCRYSDYSLQSDFSDESRAKFEEHIGMPVANWPSDIFKPGATDLSSPATNMQKLWLEFRAKTIHDFIEKAAEKAHQVNPDIKFGAYVGGWYSSYYPSGVNWAHPSYNTSADYKWATSAYKDYGYADHCDFMFIGAYAGVDRIWGSGEWTMQGFCKKAGEKLGGVPFAGGPDIGNGSGFENGGRADVIPTLIDACINASSDGLFIFDLCHIKMYDYWDAFEQGINQYLETL